MLMQADMLDCAVRTAMDADRVVDGGKAAVEPAVVELAPLRRLEMIDEILFALIADDVDEGIRKLRIVLEGRKLGHLGEGQMNREEAHVRVVPLVEPCDQLFMEVFLSYVVVEGLVGVEGAADELASP